MLSAMLRQSSGGGGGGGGSNGNKLSLGLSRLSNGHFFPTSAGTGTAGTSTGSWAMDRGAKSSSQSSVSSGSDSVDSPTADADYIMQLVNDVRRFADVLLHLKEAFHSKGEFGGVWGGGVWEAPQVAS